MGSSGKKHRDRDSRDASSNGAVGSGSTTSSSNKRHRHHGSPVPDDAHYDYGTSSRESREKRHKHRKHHHHHRDRKRDRSDRERQAEPEYVSSDSDVVEILSDSTPPPAPQLQTTTRSHHSHHHRNSHPSPTPPPRAESPQRSESPSIGGQSHDSLSIEETNRLRAKLGLKPLKVDSSARSSGGAKEGHGSQKDNSAADEKKKDDLGEFYHKPAGNIANDKAQEKIRRKLEERRERRHIDAKLAKVKSLGADNGTDDADEWVSRSRKLQAARHVAAQRAQALEELDAQFGIGEIVERETRSRDARTKAQKYTDKDLKGLRVDHDVAAFQEGVAPVILTLKDQDVLDEGEDVLVNVNLLDNERYKKSNENKKRKTPLDFNDDELDEFGNPIERSLLSKYDVEIDGEHRDNFTIGSAINNRRKATGNAANSVRERLLASSKLLMEENLNVGGPTVASEYYSEREMAAFKKPKRSKKRDAKGNIKNNLREKGTLLTADDLERSVDKKGIEEVGTRRPRRDAHVVYDDIPEMYIKPDQLNLDENDDQLERALHKARRLKQERELSDGSIAPRSTQLSDILANLKQEEDGSDNDGGIASNIVLNSTAEFCRTLGDIPTYGRSGNRDEDIDMTEEEIDRYIVDHGENNKNSIDVDADDDDCQIMETDEPGTSKHDKSGIDDKPILDEEPDVGSGVGAALKFAMSKGYLDKEESNRPSNTRLAHLQAKHYSIEDKSYEGTEGNERGGRRGQGSAMDRYSGPVQDFKEKDYKPNVKLEYIDDDGHLLNSKEAFRYLSHKFHGKGPGKNKIEKRIKKSQQEGLMKKMSSTDTPLGTLNMLQAKQKELQSAYIVLSGGKHTHSTTISKARRQ